MTDAYRDDPTIRDADPLWRRVHPHQQVVDENSGEIRPSSAAFKDHPDGSPMSIHLGRDALEAGYRPEDVLVGHDGYALAGLTAGLARDHEQGVAREPLADQIAHGIVFGPKGKRIRKALVRGATWVVPPPAGD